ncbi:hypothetical protein RO3G_05827 [Rhizopus delemar RA 99-880]|uniref:Core-binding (CB) domain-containing protein n=1 Tax=Rhizopus delemar (strain RA 99-880 / ATCC MYA-4621 / FGSC 9543 / NRRL 43880) TaxID=246409 RepID=I1BY42_RHIO9|nr:hypothetical protein RO3G_05827 [Rhizopus delemar RA 99-880]|eukprot:EIE81122.1 hypothetical protein RO3G_05827 [Rhizopus delemar RA 99-880]
MNEMKKITKVVVHHLTSLGFLINWEKSALNPSKTQEFLGFNFNTETMRIKVPQGKMNKIIQRSRQAMKTTTIRSCRWIASLIGKMTSVIPAIGEALLHVRHLQRDLTKSLRMNGYKNWEVPCVLSTHSLQDLQWWEKWSTVKNGLPIHVTPPEILMPKLTIHVDASNTGWRVKSNVMETSGFWTEEEKETSINVRELQTIYFALKLQARNAKDSTIHIFSDNKTALKYVQFDSNIQPYSGNQEYTSRPIESTSNPALRMETTKEMVQENNSQMGSPFNRCICDETKQASENVLELDAGSGGSGDECIQSDLAFEGSISEPALEINPQGIALLQETKNTRSSTGNTTMDDSILVPNDTTDDEGPTNSNETKQEVVSSRLEAIQKGQDQMKFDKTVTKFLNNKIRKRTTQAYNLGWQRWERWCNSQIPPVDPLVYNIKNLVEFFVSFQHMSIQQLKVYRAAIASVFRQIHPDQPPIASNPFIHDFFQAKIKTTIRIPKEHQIATWDLNILIDHIKNNYLNNDWLTIEQLQQKTIVLLCIATMWRPRSDIGTLQHRDIHFKRTRDGDIIGATLYIRAPKESQLTWEIQSKYDQYNRQQ